MCPENAVITLNSKAGKLSVGDKMVKVKIDNREVEVKAGTVLMEVIRETGTEVPSMCYLEGAEHFTSCMVCVVKDRIAGSSFHPVPLRWRKGWILSAWMMRLFEAQEDRPGAAAQ